MASAGTQALGYVVGATGGRAILGGRGGGGGLAGATRLRTQLPATTTDQEQTHYRLHSLSSAIYNLYSLSSTFTIICAHNYLDSL